MKFALRVLFIKMETERHLGIMVTMHYWPWPEDLLRAHAITSSLRLRVSSQELANVGLYRQF